MVAVSPLLETSQQPGGQVHGGSGGSGRARWISSWWTRKAAAEGGAAHEHPHEDEKGEPEGGGEPAGDDGRGIDSRGKWKLTC